MTSKAKIASVASLNSTVLVPYAGEQRTVRELHALNVALSAEDYAAIRRALGGGKRGRERARDMVPLECASCGCRLTHIEPAQRPSYFAPKSKSVVHGDRCGLEQVEGRVPQEDTERPVESPDANVGGGQQDSAVIGKATRYRIEEALGSDHVPASAGGELGPESPDQRGARRADDAKTVPHARALLEQALNRCIPTGSEVQLRGQPYTLVPATELHRLRDGEFVAVYGRICDAAWSDASKRLTLIAAPRTVQVWATGAVPRSVLRLDGRDPIERLTVRKPVPFIVFGKLKKLADVCGIPVVRSESFVLLQRLDIAYSRYHESPETTSLMDELDELLASPVARQSTPAESPEPATEASAAVAEQDGLHASQPLVEAPAETSSLPEVEASPEVEATPETSPPTDELDDLLSSRLSVQPAPFVSAQAAIVQAFSLQARMNEPLLAITRPR